MTRRVLLVCEAEPPADPPEGAEIWAACDLRALDARLDGETMGLRLHGHGSAPFLADLRLLAARHGMGRDEIVLRHDGSPRRRVRCVHCRITLESLGGAVCCTGCGRVLAVHDHPSHRLGTVMGVAVPTRHA